MSQYLIGFFSTAEEGFVLTIFGDCFGFCSKWWMLSNGECEKLQDVFALCIGCIVLFKDIFVGILDLYEYNVAALFSCIFEDIIEHIIEDIFGVNTSNVGALFKDIFDDILDFCKCNVAALFISIFEDIYCWYICRYIWIYHSNVAVLFKNMFNDIIEHICCVNTFVFDSFNDFNPCTVIIKKGIIKKYWTKMVILNLIYPKI